MGLSDRQVRDLIREGWNSLPLLQEATGIGTDCGKCFSELLRLLAESQPEAKGSSSRNLQTR
jgi:bacterioferritin-associated ferredoxin